MISLLGYFMLCVLDFICVLYCFIKSFLACFMDCHSIFMLNQFIFMISTGMGKVFLCHYGYILAGPVVKTKLSCLSIVNEGMLYFECQTVVAKQFSVQRLSCMKLTDTRVLNTLYLIQCSFPSSLILFPWEPSITGLFLKNFCRLW